MPAFLFFSSSARARIVREKGRVWRKLASLFAFLKMFIFCNLLRAFYATMRGASPNRGLHVSVNPGISCPRKRVCRRKAAGNWCANNRACLFVPWHSRLVPRHWWLYLATRGGRRSAAYSAAPCAAANIAIFVRHFSFFASLPRLLKPTFYLVLKQGKKVQQFIYIYMYV